MKKKNKTKRNFSLNDANEFFACTCIFFMWKMVHNAKLTNFQTGAAAGKFSSDSRWKENRRNFPRRISRRPSVFPGNNEHANLLNVLFTSPTPVVLQTHFHSTTITKITSMLRDLTSRLIVSLTPSSG